MTQTSLLRWSSDLCFGRVKTTRPLLLSTALLLSLTACGGGGAGGGGGGGGLVSTPPPPPVAATIGAPAAASAASTPASPLATTDGPTVITPGTTPLPLLQTVWTRTPTAEAADPTTISGGATLSLSPVDGQVTLSIGNSSVGVSNAVLSQVSGQPANFYSANLGSQHVDVYLETSTTAGPLSWTAFGNWGVYDNAANPAFAGKEAMFVIGYKTPSTGMPTSGTANYNGKVIGEVVFPLSATQNGIANLGGNVSLEANFATGTINGSLNNMLSYTFDLPPEPWNDVSILASFGIGQSNFSGTTAASSAPGNAYSLAGSATGTINGSFFGPSATEIGAVWTLYDGVRAAIGSFGAVADLPDDNPWDY